MTAPLAPGALRVLVLCGGESPERAVSLDSGRAVFAALRQAGANVSFAPLERDDLSGVDLDAVDIVFNACHGAFGEDGVLQELLARRGVVLTGSGAAACELAFDKVRSKEAFVSRGVPTPAWTVAMQPAEAQQRLEEGVLRLPVVAKPARGGSSQGVTLVREAPALPSAVASALAYGDVVLLEHLVAGRELTVGLLGQRALPIIELETKRSFYDYDAKYRDDDTTYLCPAPLDPVAAAAVAEAGRAAFAAVGGRDLGRVDVILDAQGTPQVLEVNMIPGFTSHSLLPKAAAEAGLPFGELCLELLRLAWERREDMT